MTELQVRSDVIEAVVAQGDLSKLTNEQRVMYYLKVCASLDLNPATRPFEYIVLNGRMVLYARKEASDQLRQARGVSVSIQSRVREDDLYIVTARAETPNGRTDESIGAVSIGGLKGDSLANALMKAETKAKRRVTLSICGLGFTDETEIETIPGARTVTVDTTTGEIKPEVAQIEAPKAGGHWIDDDKTRAEFWSYWTKKALSQADVHAALGVEHVTQFTGTKSEAFAKINGWIASKPPAF